MGTENKSKTRRRKETKLGHRNAAGEFTIHDVRFYFGILAAVRYSRVEECRAPSENKERKGQNFPLEPQILRRYFDPLGIPLEDLLFDYSSFHSKTSIVKKIVIIGNVRYRYFSFPSRRSFFHRSYYARSRRFLSFVFIYPLRTYARGSSKCTTLKFFYEELLHPLHLFTSTRNEARCQERHYSKQSVNDV